MKKLIIGNWKMNPHSRAEAIRLAKRIDLPGLVIAPPFVYLESVGKQLKKAILGAQDVFWNVDQKGGAATGEISFKMLKNLKVRYVIVGHSERRAMLGETDKIVNNKTKEILSAGLFVVVCVGEPEQIRKKGLSAAQKFVRKQLQESLKNISKIKNARTKLIIAYEPIWAIGTGVPATPKDASLMIHFIKRTVHAKKLNPKVLYGGSVNGKNIKDFLSASGIDGALVGGASIKAAEIKKIWRVATTDN